GFRGRFFAARLGSSLFGAATTAAARPAAASAAGAAPAILADGVDGGACLLRASAGDGHESLAALDALLDVGLTELDAADRGDGARRAELLKPVEDGLHDVACVGGAVALAEAVADAGHLEDVAHHAAGD